MGKFDLSDADDFARLTVGSAGGLIASFVEGQSGNWDIDEASYNGVVFSVLRTKQPYQSAVDRVEDSGGRRKAKLVYPYKDGQTTDDLGRAAYSFSVNALFHGKNYLRGLTALLAEFDKTTPGQLVHPIRGEITVAVESWNIVYENQSRNAAGVQIVFIENNFTIGSFTANEEDRSVKGALARALEAFQAIQNAANNVAAIANLVQSTKNRIRQSIEDYNNRFGQTLGRVNTVFNPSNSNDFPTLLPTQSGGNLGTDANTFNVAVSPNDPFANVPLQELSPQTQQALAAQSIQKDVDARRQELQSILNEYKTNGLELSLYDDVVNLRESAILLQEAYETGLASSRSQIIDYTVPRTMSLREIAFANGVSLDRLQDIDLLNPFLLSTNFVEKGTVLKVPL